MIDLVLSVALFVIIAVIEVALLYLFNYRVVNQKQEENRIGFMLQGKEEMLERIYAEDLIRLTRTLDELNNELVTQQEENIRLKSKIKNLSDYSKSYFTPLFDDLTGPNQNLAKFKYKITLRDHIFQYIKQYIKDVQHQATHQK